jgi:hypothetical protein
VDCHRQLKISADSIQSRRHGMRNEARNGASVAVGPCTGKGYSIGFNQTVRILYVEPSSVVTQEHGRSTTAYKVDYILKQTLAVAKRDGSIAAFIPARWIVGPDARIA